MAVAVISDLHDNLANLDIALDWIAGQAAEAILCCGDLTDEETLSRLAGRFAGPIHLVWGNADMYDLKTVGRYANVEHHGEWTRLEYGGKVVGLAHEFFHLEEIRADGPCDIIFYGHSHQPWIKELDGAIIANPGTLGGVFYKSTFAMWDPATNHLELKILEIL